MAAVDPDPQAAADFGGRLEALLTEVARGAVTPAVATQQLRHLPFADLGFARVDHHRELRQGTPEIVYGPGKSQEQVAAIVQSLLRENVGPVLVTRTTAAQRDVVRRVAAEARLADKVVVASSAIAISRSLPLPRGRVVVVTGGTADLEVADEAVLTATLVGTTVERKVDVGVAGLHRLAAVQEDLDHADVIVAVAGMEGALPSVVAGLTGRLVIACPTGVGYGASFGGLAALLGSLASCTPGTVCVNIDDGVGAGFAAALVARAAGRTSSS